MFKNIKTAEELRQNELLKELKNKIAEYKSYLLSTDWHYVRKLERNIDVPTDVVAKRAEAIKFIQDNEEII